MPAIDSKTITEINSILGNGGYRDENSNPISNKLIREILKRGNFTRENTKKAFKNSRHLSSEKENKLLVKRIKTLRAIDSETIKEITNILEEEGHCDENSNPISEELIRKIIKKENIQKGKKAKINSL